MVICKSASSVFRYEKGMYLVFEKFGIEPFNPSHFSSSVANSHKLVSDVSVVSAVKIYVCVVDMRIKFGVCRL